MGRGLGKVHGDIRQLTQRKSSYFCLHIPSFSPQHAHAHCSLVSDAVIPKHASGKLGTQDNGAAFDDHLSNPQDPATGVVKGKSHIDNIIGLHPSSYDNASNHCIEPVGQRPHLPNDTVITYVCVSKSVILFQNLHEMQFDLLTKP